MNISEFWAGLELFEKIFWLVAIPSSFSFLIIFVMTFIGGDVDSDVGDTDAEIDGDDGIGFQFFTVKNLLGFFTVFSWTGLACLDGGLGHALTLFISAIAGTMMMVVMAGIFFMMSKLTESGTMNVKNAIGSLGEVYLTIPANRDGFGKVQITVQGSVRELQAMNDTDTDLTQGMVVKVVDVIDDHILLVKKSN